MEETCTENYQTVADENLRQSLPDQEYNFEHAKYTKQNCSIFLSNQTYPDILTQSPQNYSSGKFGPFKLTFLFPEQLVTSNIFVAFMATRRLS